MNDHYFSESPSSKSEPETLSVIYKDETFRFWTDHGVFSRKELDPGSELLIETIESELTSTSPSKSMDFLDLGSGYGPVACILGKRHPKLKLHLSDVNTRAIDLCHRNLKALNLVGDVRLSDGMSAWDNHLFDMIAFNPPIRIGKQAVFRLYDEAIEHLADEGTLYLVIGKKQGADSHQRYLETHDLLKVRRLVRARGYVVLRCQKNYSDR